MKILAPALLGVLLLAGSPLLAQQDSTDSSSGKAAKASKAGKSGDERLSAAELDERIAKRLAEAKEASAKGKADVAAAIQKLVADLQAMKDALAKKDEAAYKSANEQRKKDHEALEALRGSEKGSKPEKQGGKKSSGSTTAS